MATVSSTCSSVPRSVGSVRERRRGVRFYGPIAADTNTELADVIPRGRCQRGPGLVGPECCEGEQRRATASVRICRRRARSEHEPGQRATSCPGATDRSHRYRDAAVDIERRVRPTDKLRLEPRGTRQQRRRLIDFAAANGVRRPGSDAIRFAYLWLGPASGSIPPMSASARLYRRVPACSCTVPSTAGDIDGDGDDELHSSGPRHSPEVREISRAR
jgi:hypothetical protein